MTTTLHETRTRDAAALETVETSIGRTFSLGDARRIGVSLNEGDTRRLMRGGWIARVGRGHYTILRRPQESTEPRLRLATALYADEPHYVSWAAALSHYGMTEKDPLRVPVAVRTRHRRRHVGPIRVEPVLLSVHKFYGFQAIREAGGKTMIATPEKAILDSLDNPDLGGGLAEVAKALGARWAYDPAKLVRLALRYPSETLVARLGYLMSALGVEGADELRGRVNRRRHPIALDVRGDSGNGAVMDAGWRVVDNIGRERLVTWGQL